MPQGKLAEHNQQVNIVLSRDDVAWLDAEAERQQARRSQVVRKILHDYISARK